MTELHQSFQWGYDSFHPTTQVAVALTLLTSVVLLCRRFKSYLERKKPFPELPMPPNSHILFGHMRDFKKPFQEFLRIVSVDHANEYGQTGKPVTRNRFRWI